MTPNSFLPRSLRLSTSSFTRPSYIYIVLFIIQLICTFIWVSSIQREQHAIDPNFNLIPKGNSGKFNSLVEQTRRECITTNVGRPEECSVRVENAIIQLEQLKSQMYANLGSNDFEATNPLTHTPSTTNAVATTKKPFLIIGIPTMPRQADYLTAALGAIDKQLIKDPNDPMYQQIQVWVMNNARKEPSDSVVPVHQHFDQNKLYYAERTEFHFLTNDHSLQDANPNDRDLGKPDHPGWKVRKQTRDIVKLMQAAQGQSQYYLAMEDDFELCPNTLRMIEHALRKTAAAIPSKSLTYDWVTMKMSFGFNGFMLHNNEDLQEFGRYLLEHQARRPPDHLMTEWSCGEKPQSLQYVQHRPHLTYRYNLFHHLGKLSSLRESTNGDYPVCYHPMNTEVVFPVDAFNFDGCAHDDLSPCLPPNHPAWLPPYGLDPAVLKAAADK